MEQTIISVSITILTLLRYSSAQFLPPGAPQAFQFPHPQPMALGAPGMPQPLGPMPPGFPLSMPPMHALPSMSKMPMVVMPYHSKSADQNPPRKYMYVKKPKQRHSRHRNRRYDTSDSWSASSSMEFRTRKSATRNHKSRVLTPVVSYMTKDGYVVYQKKISPKTAKEWLDMGKKKMDDDDEDYSDSDEKITKKRRKSRK